MWIAALAFSHRLLLRLINQRVPAAPGRISFEKLFFSEIQLETNSNLHLSENGIVPNPR
jgi:hypothetical protein